MMVPAKERFLMAGAVTCVVVGITTIVAHKRRRKSTAKRPKIKPDDDDDSISSEEGELPSHIQREIYKEHRRQLSVQLMAMKSPMYDNIQMHDNEGNVLCTISKKKANWYLKKDLADWIDPEHTKLKLRFAPKAKSTHADYDAARKRNICVCCGDDENHVRHYIVPYCYRTLLPEKYKSHFSHDIVILCLECHVTCEQATQKRQKAIERRLRKDPKTALAVIPNKRLYHLRGRALALLRNREQLPEEKRKEYEALVRDHFGIAHPTQTNTAIPEELLQKAISIESFETNPDYIPGANVVVDSLLSERDIEQFVLEWREHFLDTMQPRYMPTGWSLENPVHSM